MFTPPVWEAMLTVFKHAHKYMIGEQFTADHRTTTSVQQSRAISENNSREITIETRKLTF